MIKKLEFISFLFISILGPLLHFAYDFFGSNFLVGLLTPINESIWEHLKLVLLPIFVFSIFEFYILSKPKNFWFVKLTTILFTFLFILLTSYTYMNILNGTNDVVYILLFYIAIICGSLVSYNMLTCTKPVLNNTVSFILFIIIISMFALFTIYTPRLPIFLDPISNTYGINMINVY